MCPCQSLCSAQSSMAIRAAGACAINEGCSQPNSALLDISQPRADTNFMANAFPSSSGPFLGCLLGGWFLSYALLLPSYPIFPSLSPLHFLFSPLSSTLSLYHLESVHSIVCNLYLLFLITHNHIIYKKTLLYVIWRCDQFGRTKHQHRFICTYRNDGLA